MKAKKIFLILVLTFLIATATTLWVLVAVKHTNESFARETDPLLTSTAELAHVPVQPHTAMPSTTPIVPPPPETQPPTHSPMPSPTPEPTPIPSDKIIEIADDYSALYASLNSISTHYNAMAVSLIAYDGNEYEYYSYQYGFADKGDNRLVDLNTKFRIASLSKLTTVICAMTLVDDGSLDLDEDISVYLGYSVRNPNAPDTKITSRMLMQHTSSIYESKAFEESRASQSSSSTKTLLEANTSFRSVAPGSVYEYTNFGMSVLAAVCESIYGKTFDLFANEVLFAPLDIDAAYVPSRLTDTDNIAAIYGSDHSRALSVASQLRVVDSADSNQLGHDHHLAQGNLTISAVDYAKILVMLGNGGIYKDVRIITEDSADEINNTNRINGANYEVGLSTRFSAVSYMPGEVGYWHTGSAFGTYTQYVYSADNTNRGMVVFTTGADTNRTDLGMLIMADDFFSIAWQELW